MKKWLTDLPSPIDMFFQLAPLIVAVSFAVAVLAACVAFIASH